MQENIYFTEREKGLTEADSIEKNAIKTNAIKTVHFLGKRLKLEIQTNAWKNRAVASGDTLYLFLRADAGTEEREKLIQTWKKESLRKEVSRRLPVWEKKTGLYCSCWQIRDMKTRWGTCNVKTRKVWLSLQLTNLGPECLEYVILHELAHLYEPSHNARFKAYLDSQMPEWRKIQESMRLSPVESAE